jgi:transposase
VLNPERLFLLIFCEKVLDGVPCHTVAKEFGLSRNTLRRYVRKVQGGQTTNFVPSYKSNQVFNEKEEELSNYLEVMARMNHGLTTKLTTKLAYF